MIQHGRNPNPSYHACNLTIVTWIKLLTSGVLKVLTAEGQFRNPNLTEGRQRKNKTEKNSICNNFNDQVALSTNLQLQIIIQLCIGLHPV